MERDDAGGGRRGLRATASPGLLQAIGDGFGLGDVDDAVDLGGSCNLNLLVRDGARRLVVRVYRPYVSEDRLRDIHAARRALVAGGIPCAEALPARDGRPWLACGDRLVEAEAWTEHDAQMDTWDRLAASLPALGRVHALLRGVEIGPDGRRPPFANHVAARDALEQTLRGTGRMRAWGAPFADLADASERLARQVSGAEAVAADGLPRQLVHGDYWDNNVLFRGGRLVLVADLDFMGERPRIDDLGLTLYYSCLKYAAGPERLRGLVAAYESGLDRPLSGAERAALPLALARQPLWSIGGWVALLDDEESARRHASATAGEVAWALAMMRELPRWQAALA